MQTLYWWVSKLLSEWKENEGKVEENADDQWSVESRSSDEDGDDIEGDWSTLNLIARTINTRSLFLSQQHDVPDEIVEDTDNQNIVRLLSKEQRQPKWKI